MTFAQVAKRQVVGGMRSKVLAWRGEYRCLGREILLIIQHHLLLTHTM
jgi:hypothetical protein